MVNKGRTNPGDGLREDGQGEAVIGIHGVLGVDEEADGLLDGVEACDGAPLRHLGLGLHVHVHAEKHIFTVVPGRRQGITRRGRGHGDGGARRSSSSQRRSLHSRRP